MSESRQKRLRRMVNDAIHSSVTVDLLDDRPISGVTSKLRRQNTRTVDYYLRDNEQPHFIFVADRKTPTVYGDEKPFVPDRAKLSKVFHVVTDRRWLTLVGASDGEEKIEIDLADVEATNYDTESQLSSRIPEGLTNNRVILQTETLYYEVPVSSKYDEDDFVELLGYLRERAGARPRAAPLDTDASGFTLGGTERNAPDPESVRAALDDVATLPDEAMEEADELVAQAEDADRLLRELQELIETYQNHEPEETVDDVVADADSIGELREAVHDPVERHVNEAKDSAVTSAEEVQSRLADADPAVVANHALTAGKMAVPLARITGRSHVGLMLLNTIAGGLVGVHSDTAEGAPLGDVDPSEVLRHANAMAGLGEELDEIDGEAVGMLLGAGLSVSRSLAPEEYAKWVVRADPEAVMAGADRGAAFANRLGENERLGGIVGGTVGLFGSYVRSGDDGAGDYLSTILDEDLQNELLNEKE